MAMALLDSSRLQAFVGVAREGGFSRAARALGRTQSSVSEAVSQLEAELGHALFFRSSRATALTEEGRLLLEHAERILDEMRLARARLEEGAGPAEGELVVGTSDTLACYLLPPVFAAYRKRYPQVQLRLDNRPSPAVALEVRERRLPVGIVSLPLPEGAKAGGRPVVEQLQFQPLTRYQDVVICPTAHRLASKRWVQISQLLDEPLLLLDTSTSTRALLEREFQRLNRAPHVAMEARSVDVLKRLVELEFGISVVPSLSVEREVRAKTLKALPLRGLATERQVALVTHARAPLPRAAKAFLELAQQTLARAP